MAPGFDSLIISLLAMNTWWLFEAYILRYLVVSVNSMKISFQILCISDLERFSEGIYILTLLPNIWICSRFCLTLVQASFKTIIVLSVYYVDNRFCKWLAVSIASAHNWMGSLLSICKEFFICANVFQHYSAILFSSCIYSAAYSILIPLF